MQERGPGWVYLIEAVGASRYKIGRTKCVKTRFSALSSSQSAFELKLIDSVFCDDCVSRESLIHKYLSEYRVFGEWFSLPECFIPFSRKILDGDFKKIHAAEVRQARLLEVLKLKEKVATTPGLLVTKRADGHQVDWAPASQEAAQELRFLVEQLCLFSFKGKLDVPVRIKEGIEQLIGDWPQDVGELLTLCRGIDSTLPLYNPLEDKVRGHLTRKRHKTPVLTNNLTEISKLGSCAQNLVANPEEARLALLGAIHVCHQKQTTILSSKTKRRLSEQILVAADSIDQLMPVAIQLDALHPGQKSVKKKMKAALKEIRRTSAH